MKQYILLGTFFYQILTINNTISFITINSNKMEDIHNITHDT